MAAGEERRKQAVLSRIGRVRRRLNLEVQLWAAVAPVWVAVTAFVLWRVFVQRGTPILAVLCAAGAAGATLALSRRRSVSDEKAAVIADRQAGAGGLLLTRLELPVGEWELGLNQQLKTLTPPDIAVRRQVAALSAALLFLLVGLVVPLPATAAHPTNAAAATRVDQLQDKLEAVTREEPVDDAALAELERLKEELSDGSFDAADWEAADGLDKALDKQAAEASAELGRAEKAAQDLENAMAQAQSGDAQTREREALEKALMDLSDGQAKSPEEAMQQAMQGKEGQQGQGKEGQQGQGKEGQQGQGKEGQGQQGQQGKTGQQGQGSGPSRSQVSDLRKALQQRREQLSKSFGQQSGQRQASSGQQGQQGQGQQGQGQQGQGQQGQGQQGKSGEGQRGDGDSTSTAKVIPGKEHASNYVDPSTGHGWAPPGELVFGGQAEMDPDRLKFEALPEGHGGEGEELFGLRTANPKVNGAGLVVPGTGANAAGDQAPGHVEGPLLPRNRALIQRYFDSK